MQLNFTFLCNISQNTDKDISTKLFYEDIFILMSKITYTSNYIFMYAQRVFFGGEGDFLQN